MKFTFSASALNRILEYIYTSEISVDGNVKTVHEIISATKRLKINSLSPVCSVLEEALASDQDLTGEWEQNLDCKFN